MPSGSWSIAITCRFWSIVIVMGESVRGSLPRISGAATIAHIESCACASVLVIPSSGPR
jgi:hypothetical protein